MKKVIKTRKEIGYLTLGLLMASSHPYNEKFISIMNGKNLAQPRINWVMKNFIHGTKTFVLS